MGITFNDTQVNIERLYFKAAASSTYTSIQYNTSIGLNNVDLFPDSSTGVGDCIVFMINYTYGKCNKIVLNLDVGISATSITGVWEYAGGGSSSSPTWTEFTNVVDNTNNLTNTGSNTVTFDPPDSWGSHYYGCFSMYGMPMRFRITSVSGITEGGHIAPNTVPQCYCYPYSINISGFSTNTPCTFQDIYNASVSNGWNCVTKNQNQYLFNCNLQFSHSQWTYFTSSNEQIVFNYNWFMLGCQYSVITIGKKYSTTNVYGGSQIIFLGTGSINYPGSLFGNNSKIYNTQIKVIPVNITGGFNGYWGADIGSNPNQDIIDLYVENFRSINFISTSNYMSNIKLYGHHLETTGAICNNITSYGTEKCLRVSSNSNEYIHNSDFSNSTYSAINCYHSSTLSNFRHYAVDCKWGTRADSNKISWTNSSSPKSDGDHKVYETYSFLLKMVDNDGNPLENARVLLTDKNGDTVFDYLTNYDGYCYRDTGSITSCDSTSITDNTKTWTTNKYGYQEIYITGGTGVDQRRFIKNYNGTSTSLQTCPNFDITPVNNDRYIIIPYVNVKYYSPLNYLQYNSCYSSVTNLNPFTLTIIKENYNTYRSKLTINKPIDIMMVLTSKTSGIRLSGMRV